MPAIVQRIHHYLPITSKMLPTSWENLAYLGATTTLTRMMTAVARVSENRPSHNRNQNLSYQEKHQAFLERFFVEIFGTSAYVGIIHLIMDMAAKIYEKFLPRNEATSLSTVLQKIRAVRPEVAQVVEEVFGKQERGLLKRVLYDHAYLMEVRDKLKARGLYNPRMWKNELVPVLHPFAYKINRAANFSQVAGIVLGGALFGGLLIQWLNDRIFAPVLIPLIQRSLGVVKPSGGTMRAPAPPSPIKSNPFGAANMPPVSPFHSSHSPSAAFAPRMTQQPAEGVL